MHFAYVVCNRMLYVTDSMSGTPTGADPHQRFQRVNGHPDVRNESASPKQQNDLRLAKVQQACIALSHKLCRSFCL